MVVPTSASGLLIHDVGIVSHNFTSVAARGLSARESRLIPWPGTYFGGVDPIGGIGPKALSAAPFVDVVTLCYGGFVTPSVAELESVAEDFEDSDTKIALFAAVSPEHVAGRRQSVDFIIVEALCQPESTTVDPGRVHEFAIACS